MELSRLLGTSFACECGREHRVPVQAFAYQDGALDLLSAMVRQYGSQAPLATIAAVADVRTWEVCGAKTHEVLKAAGPDVARVIVPDGARGGPVCDEATFQWLVGRLRGVRPGVVVAVGSGVISDLCKWAAFELGMPYLVVATAASMNGYSAANVAPTIAGVKVLVETLPPVAVLAEPAVIEHAPHEMTAAGFGDAIAKFQSNADWIVNHLLLGEYYCGFCAGMVSELEPLYLDHPEDIRDHKSEAVGALFEALFGTGLAMTLVGTSAPASGGEHLLSHTLDMMAEARGSSHDLHGRQVGLGTVLSAALYERVLAADSPALTDMPPEIDRGFWTASSLVAAVGGQYEAKKPSAMRVRQRIAEGAMWDRLRERLVTEVRSPATIQNWLRRAGAAVSIADIGCSREQVREAILHMHEIRRRFTVVDLAWLTGVLPGAVDELIDEWLTDGA